MSHFTHNVLRTWTEYEIGHRDLDRWSQSWKQKLWAPQNFECFFNTLWVIYQVHKTHQKKSEYVFNCHASEFSIVYLLKWPVVSLQWADFQKKLNFLKDGTKIKILYSDTFVTSEPPKYSWLIFWTKCLFWFF